MNGSSARELELNGLPGPTHHFAGLATGNLAAMRHRFEVSSPRKAGLQVLETMRVLHDLGIPQAIVPPHPRPDPAILRRLGFSGTEEAVLARARRDAPALLLAACSSSAMWTANAATVSPAADAGDGRVHFTPANLGSHLHRSLETPFTAETLRRLFPDEAHFVHHVPLPAGSALRDEGAANQLRLCRGHGSPGLEVFAWGESGSTEAARPSTFAGRQTLEASQCVARLHELDPERTLLLQQDPAAIDAGVFHADVAAVADEHLLLHHERAFAGGGRAIEEIRNRFPALVAIGIGEDELPLGEAVDTYLFNSRLVTQPDGGFALVAPEECRNHPAARACLDRLLTGDDPLSTLRFVALDESMRNGGGPACLRLRVVLEEEALAAMHPGVRFDAALHRRLREWVETHYRDALALDDLADPCLLGEARTALDELTRIVDLGRLYPFQ